MAVIDSLAQCAALRVPDQLPVFCHSELFDAAYSEVGYRRYCTETSAVVDCQTRVLERFGWDCAWLHLDDVLELEPFGLGTAAEGDEPARPLTYLPFTTAQLNRLDPNLALTGERLGVLLGAVSQLRAAFGDVKCVCGRLSGPLTLLNLLFGPEAVGRAWERDARLLREALEFSVEVSIGVMAAQAAAGAHALWVDDRLACSDLISPELYKQFLLVPTQRLLHAIRAEELWGILHTAENDLAALEVHAGAQPDFLSLGPRLPLPSAHALLRKRIALMGNVDPVLLLTRGWPSQVAAYVDNLVRYMRHGGMALATAGPVPATARGPNLHTMADTARKIWAIVGGR